MKAQEKRLRKGEQTYKVEWIDSQEVCQMLNISPKTLENYRYKKTLKYSKLGGKIYYKRSDILEKLEKSYNEMND